MAETLVVQRGHIGTHNMHLYPDETPTGIWASIEAQNTGLVAGNFQNHLVCTPYSEAIEVEHWWFGHSPQKLNYWRPRWPRLGSYTRLSFRSFAAAVRWQYTVQLWDAGHSAVFYDATVAVEHNDVDFVERITLEWDMEESGLASHLNTNISMYLYAKPLFPAPNPPGLYTMQVREFTIVTANRPF
jgi:hypothetical protein